MPLKLCHIVKLHETLARFSYLNIYNKDEFLLNSFFHRDASWQGETSMSQFTFYIANMGLFMKKFGFHLI